ncbi:MAG: phosphoribulokinase [Rhodospirillales bacterium]|nr:MAG: phosphoribulokinase [Rhodospirillales bacterium]
MSKRHPVIAVTGSSGAGTSSVKEAFEHMFRRENINAAVIEGDSYHRYSRDDMKAEIEKAANNGNPHFSHFGPDANLFKELEDCFRTYGESGTGLRRFYVHNDEEAQAFGRYKVAAGEFTPWEPLPENADLLFYEGLHGCVANDNVNVARYADLKIGVVPVINLEWIQKIHRDTQTRGYSDTEVMGTILRRMHDYVHYIVPQFKLTDINFQRVPVVDTSDPIIARDIPTLDESLVVIRFNKPERHRIDFPFLLQMLKDSWMSRRNTIVVPGGKMGLAIELIFTPILRRIMEDRRSLMA